MGLRSEFVCATFTLHVCVCVVAALIMRLISNLFIITDYRLAFVVCCLSAVSWKKAHCLYVVCTSDSTL